MTKLTRSQFAEITTVKNTDYGRYYNTKTKICEYGQAYKSEADGLNRYLDLYYPIHIADWEVQNAQK